MPWVGRSPWVPTGCETFVNCSVSLNLNLPLCKVSFLPALNFCGSAAPQAEHRERAGDAGPLESRTNPGSSERRKEHKENRLLL